jgi:hypothetical protein
LGACCFPKVIDQAENRHDQAEHGPTDHTLQAKVKKPVPPALDDPVNAAAQEGVSTAHEGAKEWGRHQGSHDFARPEDMFLPHLFRPLGEYPTVQTISLPFSIRQMKPISCTPLHVFSRFSDRPTPKSP